MTGGMIYGHHCSEVLISPVLFSAETILCPLVSRMKSFGEESLCALGIDHCVILSRINNQYNL